MVPILPYFPTHTPLMFCNSFKFVRVFKLSVSSTSNVSNVEASCTDGNDPHQLGTGFRQRFWQFLTWRDTEHFQTSFLHLLLHPARNVRQHVEFSPILAEQTRPLPRCYRHACESRISLRTANRSASLWFDFERMSWWFEQRVVFRLATAQHYGASHRAPILDQMWSPEDRHSKADLRVPKSPAWSASQNTSHTLGNVCGSNTIAPTGRSRKWRPTQLEMTSPISRSRSTIETCLVSASNQMWDPSWSHGSRMMLPNRGV